MDKFLEFSTGPLFRFCFSLFILGLIRLIIITFIDIRRTASAAGDKSFKYGQALASTFDWMLPVRQILKTRVFFSLTSFIFHAGLIIVPIFLLEHVLLWKKGAGVSWPFLNSTVSDILTVLTVIAAFILLSYRIFSSTRRFISDRQDYFFLVLIMIIFVSGFIVPRSYNPLSYQASMLVHVLSGNLLLVLIPFTRLSHSVLYPFIRIASETAWHFQGDAGKKLNKTLYGEENRKI